MNTGATEFRFCFFPNDIMVNIVLTTTPFRIHHLHYTSPINTMYITPFTIHHLRYISPKTQCTLHLSPCTMFLHLSPCTMFLHHSQITVYALQFPMHNFRYISPKTQCTWHLSPCTMFFTPFPITIYAIQFPIHNVRYKVRIKPYTLHPFLYTISITLFTKHYLHSTLHLPQNTI
jgi:hypothetical protein